MIESLDVKVGRVRIACQVRGAPDAPAMVLLHALGEDAGTWDAVAAEFAKDFRVFAVDLRGHGGSDRPGTYAFELMRDDVMGVLDHLGLRRVTLVGHSMGGTVAYLIAEQEPDRIDRLIVEDPPPPIPRSRAVPERPDEPLPFDWAVVPAIYAQLNDPDPAWWEDLTRITAPTLLIAGGPASHIPQDKLREVAARVPQCTMVTIPAGHHVHTIRPEEFTAAVRDFLRRQDRRIEYGPVVIFHIAEVSDWRAAQVAGDYRVSTRGRTLADEGFIHASRREQALDVANAFYADAGPLLLLSIDPVRLSSPVRDDEVAPGVVFPHIYGPIDLDAVVDVAPLERGSDGRFVLPGR